MISLAVATTLDSRDESLTEFVQQSRLAVFGLIGFMNLHGMNGLKNLLSAVLSVVSVTTYAIAGLIAWEHAAVLALSTTVGGYIGSQQARRVQRTSLLRAAIVAVGAVFTVVFFAP